MCGMPRKLPLHVTKERTRHGRVVFYFRIGKGQRTRLPEYGTEEFTAAYSALLRGEQPEQITSTAPHTFKWLVLRYQESGTWGLLSPATKKQRARLYGQVIKAVGNTPFLHINQQSVQLSLQKRSHTPAEANNLLKSLRVLFAWAKLNGHVEVNPTDGVQPLQYKSAGFKAWTIDDAEQFRDHWPIGTMPRLAFELMLCSGVRRGDMFQMGPQHRRGNTIIMRTQKTKTPISVALTPSAIEAINATQCGDMRYMVKPNGAAFSSKESFGNWFGARCRDAKLEVGKSAHGIRKLSATLAAEGGASNHELMAHYGWETPKQSETYTRMASRTRLAAASSKRLAEEIENRLSRTLQTGAGKKAEKSLKTKG